MKALASRSHGRVPVSRKKHKSHAHVPLPDLKTRTTRAVHEGRFQAALELAKELYKQTPTPEHRALVREVYLGRARQLRSQGKPRDAATVLQAAIPYADGDAAWLGQVAEELAACGEARQALALLGPTAGTPAHTRILALVADRAVQQEAAGRSLLPEALHADLDRILQAAAQLEAGQDDAARETLQGIGLRSPFLEWKVLLRGLQAYYQNDDARALENWQRLSPDRLPARLAAPFRFTLDRDYRLAQPPETQTSLQRQADHLRGLSVVHDLRTIQAALSREESLARAFRLAESLLPGLRQHGERLPTRLASAFYWAIIANGQPEDVPRYQRVFGAPPHDPRLDRLRALLCEHTGELEEAHRHWQQFEKSVAGSPAFPGEQADRVRALVWFHMGQTAAKLPNEEDLRELPPFFRGPMRPPRLVPGAEACLQNSLKLAPDQLAPHAALFDYHQSHKHDAKAEKAARQLLERFPEHAPTLEALADLCMRKGRYSEALELYQRALRTNPLSRPLRGKVSGAHLFRARTHAEEGEFDAARADYQAALAFRDGEDYPALCKWAACEFKAGNPERAEELLQKALAEAGTGLAVSYSMVIECIRLKLPRALKTRFDREFNAALAEPPSPAAAVAILSTTAAHRSAGVTYHGQKTHEKKVLAYVNKARDADCTQPQLVALCEALLTFRALRVLRTFAELGRDRFPADPQFPFLQAESYFAEGPDRWAPWQVQALLQEARQKAEQLPREPRQQELLENIREREEMVRSLNPFFDLLTGNMDPFGFYEDEDEDEFYDDDEW
jgi:tetratricopeptide (TPR) repeat protein